MNKRIGKFRLWDILVASTFFAGSVMLGLALTYVPEAWLLFVAILTLSMPIPMALFSKEA